MQGAQNGLMRVLTFVPGQVSTTAFNLTREAREVWVADASEWMWQALVGERAATSGSASLASGELPHAASDDVVVRSEA